MATTSSRSFLDRDTQLCMSLSGRPSNIGTRFHNYLYDELGLNFVYKAFTTTDSTFTIDAGTDVARVISVTAVNKWGESFGGVPYYIKPHEIVVDPSSAIIHEQDSAHYFITTNVPEAGNYLMWINYIAQERSAARLVSINTHLQGMAVMPRREKVHSLPNVISDSAVDIIESNVINVLLLKGKNTISLEAPDDNITLPHYRNKVKIFNIILVKK